MNKTFSLFPLLTLTILLSGCFPHRFNDLPNKVTIMPNDPFIQENCKFIKDIYADDVHGESTNFYSSVSLEDDDISYLRSEGVKLGANVVVYKEHQIIETPHASVPNKQKFYMQSKHIIRGIAYLCPESYVGRIIRKRID